MQEIEPPIQPSISPNYQDNLTPIQREFRERYAGQWVTLNHDGLVSSGKTPAEALNQAKIKGITDSYLYYVKNDGQKDHLLL